MTKKAQPAKPDKPKPVSIYLPADLHKWVSEQAAAEGRSISMFIKLQLEKIRSDQ